MSDIPKIIVDPTPLRVLRDAGVGTENLKEVCSLFEAAIDTGLKELSQSAAEKNRLKDIAHRLRGSCLSIGALQLDERLRKYSDKVDDGQLPDLSEIRAEFENTKLALMTLMNELEKPEASA